MVGVVLLAAAPASAHAVLESTDPPSGGTVDSSPSAITLTFSESVQVRSDAIRLIDGRGNDIAVGAPEHPGGRATVVRVSVPKLDNGLYAVAWRAVSADSHPVQGAFTFGVGAAGTGKAASALAAQASATAKGDRVVGVTFAIVRFLVYVGLALLLGAVWFAASLWPAGRSRRRVHQLLWGAWGLTTLATIAGFLLQGPYTSGGGLADAFTTDQISAVWDTRFGKVWALRLGLLVIAALLVGMMERTRDALPDWWFDVAGVVGVALAATPGLAGHASTGRWVVLAIPADALHVLAMAVWMGGLAMLVLARADGDFARIVTRFSSLAFAAVAVIVVTGSFQAVRQVPSLSDLWDTDYGRLLVAKLCVFAVVLGLAAWSRRLVHGPGLGLRRVETAEPASPGSRATDLPATSDAAVVTLAPPAVAEQPERTTVEPARLVRSVLVELALGAVILGLTAGLVNSAPPRAVVASGPLQTLLGQGKVRLDTFFGPARSDATNELHLTAVDRNGLPVEVVDMQASLANPTRDLPPIEINLTKAGTGHFLAQDVRVPFPGQWQLSITTFTTDVDSFTVTATVGVT